MEVKKVVYGLLFVGFFLTSCQFVDKQNKTASNKETAGESNTTKKKKQKQPVDLNKPVAVYRANEDDAATNNDFVVKVYPTKNVEQFKVVMNFGKNSAQTNIKFPNPKYFKKVALRKSDTANACLLGFIGKDGSFNEMKKIVCTSSQIKVNSIKAYYFKTK